MLQGVPRDSYQVRLRDALSIGTAPGRPAWVLLLLGSGTVRSLAMFTQPWLPGNRLPELPPFRSLAEYLAYLREYRVDVSSNGEAT